jgi:hypothetical protein
MTIVESIAFLTESVPGFELDISSAFPERLKEGRNCMLQLLYRGSRDDLNSLDFRGIAMVKVTQSHSWTLRKISFLGGYTPLSWDFTSGWKADSNQQCFVFAMINPHNFGLSTFPFEPNHLQYATD